VAAHRWWVPYIIAQARRRGLDPNAVLGIAAHEGLSGGVGDSGTSYGPFQLHRGGALPAGKSQQWAESKAGISYALDRIAGVARGLRGRQAVEAISRRFERPADPASEIADAMRHYGHVSASGGNMGGMVSGPGSGPAGPQAGAGGLLGPSGNPIFAALLESSNELAAGHLPDSNTLLGALAAQREMASQPSPQAQQVASQVQGIGGPRGGGGQGINELFYDPLGAIKNGQAIHAIGGHNDHVHVSLKSEAAQRAAIAQAQRMGLHVGQDTDRNVTQVHVSDSYHYRHYRKGDPLRMAADVSGDAGKMSAFYRWVARNYR
jgi:hypothetical protein